MKVGGDAERDVQRLTRIAGVLDTEIDRKYAATLDANERFADATAFCAF